MSFSFLKKKKAIERKDIKTKLKLILYFCLLEVQDVSICLYLSSLKVYYPSQPWLILPSFLGNTLG